MTTRYYLTARFDRHGLCLHTFGQITDEGEDTPALSAIFMPAHLKRFFHIHHHKGSVYAEHLVGITDTIAHLKTEAHLHTVIDDEQGNLRLTVHQGPYPVQQHIPDYIERLATKNDRYMHALYAKNRQRVNDPDQRVQWDRYCATKVKQQAAWRTLYQQKWCPCCGNHQAEYRELSACNQALPGICLVCQSKINGPLALAFKFWVSQQDMTATCCEGMSSCGTYFHFHGKDWAGIYPPAVEGSTENDPSVCVEMGVSFYEKGAQTYYLRDFDNYCDSVDYGDMIPYGQHDFWDILDNQLDEAPEHAWHADLQTCAASGYHCACMDTDGLCPYTNDEESDERD
jgi:hypothetical protein